jgi:hypothetical protein
MSKWTDRTRDKRRKRLAKAAYRRDVVRMFNARGREWRVLNRKQRRADARRVLEWRAQELAIPTAGEFTKPLRARVVRALRFPNVGLTRADIEEATGGVVSTPSIGTVRVTMPGGTSAAEMQHHHDWLAENMPAHIAVEVA